MGSARWLSGQLELRLSKILSRFEDIHWFLAQYKPSACWRTQAPREETILLGSTVCIQEAVRWLITAEHRIQLRCPSRWRPSLSVVHPRNGKDTTTTGLQLHVRCYAWSACRKPWSTISNAALKAMSARSVTCLTSMLSRTTEINLKRNVCLNSLFWSLIVAFALCRMLGRLLVGLGRNSAI